MFYGGQRGARFTYTVKGRGTPVRVDLVRVDTGTVVATWSAGNVAPAQPQSIAWPGGTAGGDARYQFQLYTGADAAPHAAATASGAAGLPDVADSFIYIQHVFPIRGRSTRSPAWSLGIASPDLAGGTKRRYLRAQSLAVGERC